MWNVDDPDVSVKHVILVSPYEADFIIRQLRLPTARGCSLHRFAPRIRRDQHELLVSGMTSWASAGPVVPKEVVDQEMHFAIMALSLFGSSTCLDSNGSEMRSVLSVCN